MNNISTIMQSYRISIIFLGNFFSGVENLCRRSDPGRGSVGLLLLPSVSPLLPRGLPAWFFLTNVEMSYLNQLKTPLYRLHINYKTCSDTDSTAITKITLTPTPAPDLLQKRILKFSWKKFCLRTVRSIIFFMAWVVDFKYFTWVCIACHFSTWLDYKIQTFHVNLSYAAATTKIEMKHCYIMYY